ncbi:MULTISPECIES: ATP-binding protein [unclassified Nocardioides]|uniref:ATP-binding protein n=1 Tax=unclassified Nocardioides TaxID=2615069 RepID=UPI0036086360
MAGEGYVFEGLAVPAEIGRVHDLLEEARAEHPEIPPTDLMLFETALVEIANNVVEHGRPAGRVEWRLTVRVRPGAIEAELDDTSVATAPTERAVMPGEEAEGGRGLAIAEAILDGMELDRSEHGNHWRLMRRFSS